jgi:hypothetical protein
MQGPTLPTRSDLVIAREETDSLRAAERDLKRKRDKLETKDRIEEMAGPKEVGREGMLEKKRARREADRSFRERGDDGFEADESTLMGGGDSFQQQYVILLRYAAHATHAHLSLGTQDRSTRCRAQAEGRR